MPTACILLANGFEEIEAITLIDVLRRASVEVTLLGVEGREVIGAHQIPITADATLVECAGAPWDLVLLPGGLPGAHTLRDSAAVRDLITRQHQKQKRIAAICAAPIALGAAGVLAGKRATCYPGFESELAGATVSQERVVQDGHITTSRGPGTAMALALNLVAELVGQNVAAQLRHKMLV